MLEKLVTNILAILLMSEKYYLSEAAKVSKFDGAASLEDKMIISI